MSLVRENIPERKRILFGRILDKTYGIIRMMTMSGETSLALEYVKYMGKVLGHKTSQKEHPDIFCSALKPAIWYVVLH